MTPVRALFAGLIAAILFAAGLFIATNFAGGRPHDLAPLLLTGREPFDLLCFLAAWGALLGGALGVLTAFLAFIAPDEDDDPRFPRRGFPKSAPPILIVIGLALAYVALRCGGGRPRRRLRCRRRWMRLRKSSCSAASRSRRQSMNRRRKPRRRLTRRRQCRPRRRRPSSLRTRTRWFATMAPCG
jgi:hypothetical protein